MTAAPVPTPALTSDDAPLRAVIYCRISKDSAKLGLGVERQREACEAMARRYRWNVVRVLVENDTSSLSKPRPLYRELLEMIEDGEVDVVLSWAQDRLLRRPLELEGLIEIADRRPFTIAHQIDMWTDLSTASGREMARYHVARSKGEVERKSERQKAANVQSAGNGNPPATRAYGYERNGELHPEESKYVPELFTRFAAGATLGGLTDWFNSEGQRPSRNGRGGPRRDHWSRIGVRQLLMNRRYVGERWRNGEFVTVGNWQPLVDADLFEAVQARLRDPARRTNTGSARKWIGAGFYVCGVCGGPTKTWCQTWKLADGTHVSGRRYECRASRHLIRSAVDIDNFVEEKIDAWLHEHRGDLGLIRNDGVVVA